MKFLAAALLFGTVFTQIGLAQGSEEDVVAE
jgi:hypothetical protein